jgi:ribosomal protein L1
MMRGTTILPHGTGKTQRIAVFTTEEAEAKKA